MTDQVTDEEVTQGDSDRILSATTFRFDTLCRLVEAKNDDATVTYEYDDASRLTTETINKAEKELSDNDVMYIEKALNIKLPDEFIEFYKK